MYSNFVFLDRFLFELSCKNTHTHTHTHTHTDSKEYPLVNSNNDTPTDLSSFHTPTASHNLYYFKVRVFKSMVLVITANIKYIKS